MEYSSTVYVSGTANTVNKVDYNNATALKQLSTAPCAVVVVKSLLPLM